MSSIIQRRIWLRAIEAREAQSPVRVGCQGVYRRMLLPVGILRTDDDRPAAARTAMGCTDVLIGHCEERNDKAGILQEAGVTDPAAINRLLNQEIRCATARGMKVLYCIGEKSEEQPPVGGRARRTASGRTGWH